MRPRELLCLGSALSWRPLPHPWSSGGALPIVSTSVFPLPTSLVPKLCLKPLGVSSEQLGKE